MTRKGPPEEGGPFLYCLTGLPAAPLAPPVGRRGDRESLALRRKYLHAGSWLIASSEGVLGEHYVASKEYGKAEALLVHAQKAFVAALGEGHARTMVNTRRLVALYTAWGRPSKAAEYAARLPAPK